MQAVIYKHSFRIVNLDSCYKLYVAIGKLIIFAHSYMLILFLHGNFKHPCTSCFNLLNSKSEQTAVASCFLTYIGCRREYRRKGKIIREM